MKMMLGCDVCQKFGFLPGPRATLVRAGRLTQIRPSSSHHCGFRKLCSLAVMSVTPLAQHKRATSSGKHWAMEENPGAESRLAAVVLTIQHVSSEIE